MKRVCDLKPGDRLQPGRIKRAKQEIEMHSERLRVDLLKRVNELPIERTCIVFGCGKKLTRQERLFGERCVKHN